MKVLPITNNQTNQKPPTFKSRWLTRARGFENTLAKKGIQCEFHNNAFVGSCVISVAYIYQKLFGTKCFPNRVDFEPIDSGYGQYDILTKNISINSNYPCFNDRDALKCEMELSKNCFFMPDEKSTSHYLRTFVHEFGHSAHHQNLISNNQGDAIYLFNNMRIPNAIGRFIAKFKLGKYSASNMTEFMAERMSKDICSNLDSYNNFKGDPKALDYSRIFSNKWNCRYITPQSYLDYYTQQVWNGDIEGADRVLTEMEEYQAAIERKERLSAVEIERPKAESSLKQTSLLGRLDKFFGSLFSTPKYLDNMNKLEINIEDD